MPLKRSCDMVYTVLNTVAEQHGSEDLLATHPSKQFSFDMAAAVSLSRHDTVDVMRENSDVMQRSAWPWTAEEAIGLGNLARLFKTIRAGAHSSSSCAPIKLRA